MFSFHVPMPEHVEIDNPEHVIAPGMSLGKREIIREGPGMLGGLTR